MTSVIFHQHLSHIGILAMAIVHQSSGIVIRSRSIYTSPKKRWVEHTSSIIVRGICIIIIGQRIGAAIVWSIQHIARRNHEQNANEYPKHGTSDAYVLNFEHG
jgi:ABC-type nickel/cobalt efflux system permease component RcnA